MVDFEFAKDKVLMGAERRSMIVTEEEKRVTAIHEAGHALLAVLLPQADALHKVTIIPRGMALGLTTQLPLDEKHNYSKVYLMDRIAILLGGRIAEEITTGDITTGAGNDLERATEMARKMVCEWGMSDAMGPLTFGKKEEQIFLGREIAQQQDYSGVTAERIDQEVKRIVSENYDKATTLLTAHKHHLLAIAEALLARESLDGEQVKRLVDGLAIDDVPPAAPPPPPLGRHPRASARTRARAAAADRSQAAGPGVIAPAGRPARCGRGPPHDRRARGLHAVAAARPGAARARRAHARHGRAQRHPRLLLGRRPGARSRAARSIGRWRWRRPAPT